MKEELINQVHSLMDAFHRGDAEMKEEEVAVAIAIASDPIIHIQFAGDERSREEIFFMMGMALAHGIAKQNKTSIEDEVENIVDMFVDFSKLYIQMEGNNNE